MNMKLYLTVLLLLTWCAKFDSIVFKMLLKLACTMLRVCDNFYNLKNIANTIVCCILLYSYVDSCV